MASVYFSYIPLKTTTVNHELVPIQGIALIQFRQETWTPLTSRVGIKQCVLYFVQKSPITLAAFVIKDNFLGVSLAQLRTRTNRRDNLRGL